MLVSEHDTMNEGKLIFADIDSEDDVIELPAMELYHWHLPRLVEAGYIEWDSDTHTIQRRPNFDEIVPLLDLITDYEDELIGGDLAK